MKKKEMLNIMRSRIALGNFDEKRMNTKSEIENQIRKVADEDEVFENSVFELGCSVLTKQYLASKSKVEASIGNYLLLVGCFILGWLLHQLCLSVF